MRSGNKWKSSPLESECDPAPSSAATPQKPQIPFQQPVEREPCEQQLTSEAAPCQPYSGGSDSIRLPRFPWLT
ncbi:hypothetical protein STEG23_011041, partial [Scotinomys teguina]